MLIAIFEHYQKSAIRRLIFLSTELVFSLRTRYTLHDSVVVHGSLGVGFRWGPPLWISTTNYRRCKMSQEASVAAFIVLCLIALCLASQKFRRGLTRLILVMPNLRIEELPDIFSGDQTFHIEHNPPIVMPGADINVQVRSEKVSIIYHASRRKPQLTETVNISYPGKFGMIMTLRDGKMRVFERIGGLTRNEPDLSRTEEVAVTRFMKDLRARVRGE